jgi:acetolactate synthase I/II/III large subunit
MVTYRVHRGRREGDEWLVGSWARESLETNAVNNAELIVSILKAAGIRRGFGVPSGNVLPLMEALRTGGIDFVLTAHEGSAGFAADVSARMTGAPGLCIATLGPGATNLATGVGCAYLDRSAMIAITCTLNEAQLGRRIQMWIDHEALFKPITKASFMLRTGSIAATVIEALRIATSEPPGPVHLDLPEDVALAAVEEPIDFGDVRSASTQPAGTSMEQRSHTDALARAAALLGSAKRPLAVIGAGALRMRHTDTLLEFVDRHTVPFATTTMAKGVIDETHPLSVGCIERAMRQVQRRFIQTQADLIVGIGYDTVEVEYEAWTGRCPVLHIDTEAADVDASVRLEHSVIGDLDASVSALTALQCLENDWRTARSDGRVRVARVEEHRAAFQRALRPAAGGFTPHEAIDVVRRLLPREGVLAFDVGAHTHQIASQWTAHAPRTFLITNGWSSMGFGLPAAIAAKLARPDVPVVCIVGDGCFQMTCGELAVARRERLAIPFVVLDDGWLSLIKVKQERRSIPHYGTAIPMGSPTPPAHYFGVPVIAAADGAGLERALERALIADGPTVIETRVDPGHYSETVYD